MYTYESSYDVFILQYVQSVIIGTFGIHPQFTVSSCRDRGTAPEDTSDRGRRPSLANKPTEQPAANSAAMATSESFSNPSILDRLASHTQQTPDKLAFTFLGNGPNGGKLEKSLTYRQLSEETDRIASVLDATENLGRGEVAVLVYPPSLDFMVAFISCLKAGIVAVPVFPPHPARRDTLFAFSGIVSDCGARHALTSKTYNHMKKLGNIKETFGRLKRPSANAQWPEQLEWIVTDQGEGASSSPADSTPPLNLPAPSDLAFLQFTSGSTSEPKGVMITHGNLSHNLTIITEELRATDDTVVVSWLPQYHDMGLIGSYLGALYCGGSGYYLSPLTFLQRPMIWMEAVSKYRATHLQAPNFAFKLTARKFDGNKGSTLDFSSVRHIINAAEPVTADSINIFADAFGPFGLRREAIYPTYGLAEHTVFVCSGGKQQLRVNKHALEVDGVVKEMAKRSGDEASTTLLGCGFPARQGVDVRIVNTDEIKEVGNDLVGEIWVRSPSKAAGYWKKPGVTKTEFCAALIVENDEEGSRPTSTSSDLSLGYLRTGDLGFLHQGEIFICGRLKDLIIVGGRNYYPQDIEATAEGTVNVLRPGCSAAFSIDSDGAADEEVVLVAELREAPSTKETESICQPIVEKLRAAINQQHSLGLTHLILLKPRTVPKTTSGKIARAWCRKAFVGKTLDIVYSKAYKVGVVVPDNFESAGAQTLVNAASATAPVDPKVIRQMDKRDILEKLINDVCRFGSLSPTMVDQTAPLIGVLDSLSLSQFKGMLESEYSTKLSDEYLFREDTSLTKLVEVVKLGYAPDDNGENANAASTQYVTNPNSSGGIAGALGCPPGVVCCVIS